MKILLIVLIALGFLWSLPETRDTVRARAEPVLAAVRPLVDRVLNPTRIKGVEREISLIVRALRNDRISGQPLPAAQNFAAWLRRKSIDGKDELDPWGQPYYLIPGGSGDQVTVGSAGPDREMNTADDIRETASVR